MCRIFTQAELKRLSTINDKLTSSLRKHSNLSDDPVAQNGSRNTKPLRSVENVNLNLPGIKYNWWEKIDEKKILTEDQKM